MKYRTRPRTAYIAGRFERRDEFIAAEKTLEEHNILSGTRWLHMEQDMRVSDDDHRKQWAMNDYADVINADFLLVFSEDLSQIGNGVIARGDKTSSDLYVPALWARGGRHVEFGIALASSVDIVVIGPKENIFHWYDPRIKEDTEPLIRHFDTLEDFLAWYDEANILPADADVNESDEASI
jgi:hypothetical protein